MGARGSEGMDGGRRLAGVRGWEAGGGDGGESRGLPMVVRRCGGWEAAMDERRRVGEEPGRCCTAKRIGRGRAMREGLFIRPT